MEKDGQHLADKKEQNKSICKTMKKGFQKDTAAFISMNHDRTMGTPTSAPAMENHGQSLWGITDGIPIKLIGATGSPA